MRKILGTILTAGVVLLPIAFASPANAVAGCPTGGGATHVRGADVRNTSVGIALGVVHINDNDYGHQPVGNVGYDFAIPDGGTWSNSCTGWDATRGFSIGHRYCAKIWRVAANGSLIPQGDFNNSKPNWGYGVHPIGDPYYVDAFSDPANNNAQSSCYDPFRP